MAAPIAMLSSLTLAAQHGILVKDGRALELMRKVDTFLFDKTGTLTRERPEVGRILTFGPYSEQQILQWAAAAENKFSHPIAKAILDKFKSLGIPLSQTDESKYQVCYGITVNVEGHTVRAGSARFLKHEGIRLPTFLEREMESVYAEDKSLIMVGVDDALGGAIEMRAANPPETEEVIAGLRAGGQQMVNGLLLIRTLSFSFAAPLHLGDRSISETSPKDSLFGSGRWRLGFRPRYTA